MSKSDEEKLLDLLKENSKEGKITCQVCHEISEKYSYSLKKVGEAANEMELKIVNCNLGCF